MLNAVKKIWEGFQRILDKVLGPRCKKCGSRDLHRSHFYTRGYNDMCRQASGDTGTLCRDCGYMKWEQSLEDYKAALPEWCQAYDDRPNSESPDS